jgi:hypothetical protein
MFRQVNRFKMSNILITHLDGYFHASYSPFWYFLLPVQADSVENVVVNILSVPVGDPCEPTDFAPVLDFPLAAQGQTGVLMAAVQPCAGEALALMVMVAAQPYEEELLALILMAAAQPCEGEMHALVLTVAGHHAADDRALVGAGVSGHHAADDRAPVGVGVSGHHAADDRALVGAGVPGHPFADDPSRYDYTVLFLCHPSSHAYTSHNGPSAVFHPMSASFCGGRNSVYGNIQTAHSKHIPAVSQ